MGNPPPIFHFFLFLFFCRPLVYLCFLPPRAFGVDSPRAVRSVSLLCISSWRSSRVEIMRRVGKDSTPSRDSSAGDPVKRRQSLSSAVSAFASELRSHTKKPGTVVLSRIASASPSKSTDDLSLANAARSKSCTHLPATNTASEGPLLTLVLAGTSFLDTTISESGERLYVIDTKGARTNISREDPVQGVAHVGAVSWLDDKAEDRPLVPRHRATIQMAHGRRYFVDEFLRRTKLTRSARVPIFSFTPCFMLTSSHQITSVRACSTSLTIHMR